MSGRGVTYNILHCQKYCLSETLRVLPLPSKYRKQIKTSLSSFLFQGMAEIRTAQHCCAGTVPAPQADHPHLEQARQDLLQASGVLSGSSVEKHKLWKRFSRAGRAWSSVPPVTKKFSFAWADAGNIGEGIDEVKSRGTTWRKSGPRSSTIPGWPHYLPSKGWGQIPLT